MPGRSDLISSINVQNWRRDNGSTPGRGLVEDEKIGIVDQASSRARASASCRPRACRQGGAEKAEGRSRAADDRCARGVRPRSGRTNDRRNRCSRTPKARDKDCGPAPAAYRRCATIRRRDAHAKRCRRRASGSSRTASRRTPAISAEQRRLANPVGTDKGGRAAPRNRQRNHHRRRLPCTVAVRDAPHLDRNRLARFFGHFLFGEHRADAASR